MKALRLPLACLLIIAGAAHAGKHALQATHTNNIAHHTSKQLKDNDRRLR